MYGIDVRRLLSLVRSARRSFRGSLELRLGIAVVAAVGAGATAGMLPSVIGHAVATIAGGPTSAASGALGALLRALPPHRAVLFVVTALATAIVVAIGVLTTKLSSSLSGDLTAAMRIELMRSVVASSARAAFAAGAVLTQPERPSGMDGPPSPRSGAPGQPGNPRPGGAVPPGATAAGSNLEVQRASVVQLAVSREAGLVSDFIVSVATSLPQALATLTLLTIELLSGGAWAVLVGGGGLFLASRILSDRASRGISDARKELHAADAAVFGNLQETLGALEDLRLWGAREQAVAEFARRSHACAEARRGFAVAMASAGQVRSVFTAMSPLLVVLALEVGGRTFDPGEVAKLMLYVPLLLGRLEVLDGVRQGLIERGPVLDATGELLALEASPSRSTNPVAIDMTKVNGELTFEEVRFTPPGAARPVLDGVSLQVPAGAVVGICGASGCGKSTLLRLALRLDDPDAGRVLLDGVDVKAIAPEQLPRLFGVLRQTSQSLERSVRENLAIGLDPVPDDEVLRGVLRLVDLESLSEREGGRGLDTAVRRQPPNFSGGETRRLLLARMMLAGAPVNVLDEPEAGLPSATAEQLLETLVRGAGGRTHLVVTHAPHLLRSDFNVVLREGKVIAEGTHAELSATCEDYRALLADALRGPDALGG